MTKKLINAVLVFCISCLFCSAQFSTYYTSEIMKAVYDVNDMQPQEIRDYNEWMHKWGEDLCLLHINAERAHANLINAPSTIIGFVFWGEVTNYDKMPDCIGAQNISIHLINASPKTIKTIIFKFAFYNQDGTQVFDTKTGNSYFSLTFSNLKGRSNSNTHNQIALDMFNCYHLLTLNDATEKTLFYNNKIATCRLEDIKVLYEDGTESNVASFVEKSCTSVLDFLKQSPLVPILDSYNPSFSNRQIFLNGHPVVVTDNYYDMVVVAPEVPTSVPALEEPKPEPKATSEEVFHSAATMPSFPGGTGALNKYLSSHVKYPAAAQENNVQGKVVVQFVVEKDGRVGEVKVARGVDKDLDHEAVRVVKSLPKFSPGKDANGDPVRVWYTVPVTFKLLPNMNTLIKEWETIYKQYYNLLSQ